MTRFERVGFAGVRTPNEGRGATEGRAGGTSVEGAGAVGAGASKGEADGRGADGRGRAGGRGALDPRAELGRAAVGSARGAKLDAARGAKLGSARAGLASAGASGRARISVRARAGARAVSVRAGAGARVTADVGAATGDRALDSARALVSACPLVSPCRLVSAYASASLDISASSCARLGTSDTRALTSRAIRGVVLAVPSSLAKLRASCCPRLARGSVRGVVETGCGDACAASALRGVGSFGVGMRGSVSCSVGFRGVVRDVARAGVGADGTCGISSTSISAERLGRARGFRGVDSTGASSAGGGGARPRM